MNPSLALIPSAYSAGKLYSVLPENGTGDFTVSRNGTATYLGSDGLLKTAQANEPRLEFNSDGSFKGVLVEPAATNLLLQSEDFENSYWTKTANVIITPNFGIAPNGLQESSKIEFGLNTLEAIYRLSSFNGNKTSSLYVKGVSGQVVRFGSGVNIGGGLGEIFTLNGSWQRLIFTRDASESLIGLSVSSTETNRVVEIWGAQLETGSVATSYIPTVASTVTRPADVITRTNAQDLIGQTEGTIYTEFRLTNLNKLSYILTISSNIAGSNVVSISLEDNNVFRMILRANGVQLFARDSSIVSTSVYKIAFAYKSGDSRVCINGSLLPINTQTFQFSDQLSNCIVGSLFSTSRFLNDHIQKVFIFKTRLSDAQLQALTTL